MKKAPPPPTLTAVFERAVMSLRGTERRKMFGQPAVFVNGNMFAGLVRDRMILRLSLTDVEKFLAHRGAKPFIAMGGRRMKQWVVVPVAMLRSQRALKTWLGRALACGRSLPAKAGRLRKQRAPQSSRPMSATSPPQVG